MKKIIFVSKLSSLNSNASSTDITTNNLIDGLHDLNLEIIFIVFGNDINDTYKRDIINSYSSKINKFIFLKCPIGNVHNKYVSLFKTIKYFFRKNYYKKFVASLKENIDDSTILLSHSPSIETILLCREIKKNYIIRWIEYWSDPYTLNGINPENYNFKRFLFKALENKFLSYCDEIVYAPKTLYTFQKRFLTNYSYKMRYVEASYCNNNYDDENKLQPSLFIYAGNYYSSIRNIKPLFDAFLELKEYELDVFGSGDISCSSSNVNIKGRISPNELKNIESKYQNIVCIMNSNCIQIPGKIFYRMNHNQNILVICDGIHQDELIDYLKSFKRFVIVKNNKESIINGIKNINKCKFDTKAINCDYSPKKVAYDIIKKKE